MTPPTPSDDMWIELAQFDTRRADGIWDGSRAEGDDDAGGPRWRDDLAALVEKARGPATPDELAHEAAVVEAMRAARESTHGGRARQVSCGVRPGLVPASAPEASDDGEGADDRVPVGAGAGVGASGADAGADVVAADAFRRRRGSVRLLGRVVVAKGVAAVGAVGFGVAAAAATTGIVASGIVAATLVAPNRVEKAPTTTESPMEWPPDLSGPDTPSSGLGRDGGTTGDPGEARDGRSPGGQDGGSGRKGDERSSKRPDAPPALEAGEITEDDATGEDSATGDSGETPDTTVPPVEATPPPVTEPPPEESTTTTSSTSTTTTTIEPTIDPGDGTGGGATAAPMATGAPSGADEGRRDACARTGSPGPPSLCLGAATPGTR